MKHLFAFVFAAALVISAAGIARCADKVEERVVANFFMPEQIIQSAEVLQLTEDQKTTLPGAHEKAKQKTEELKQQMDAALDKFVELSKPQRVDEKVLLAQGDKALDIDREIKHVQLSLLATIKNTLTPEQHAVLNNIKALAPKIREVKQLADKLKADGRDLSKMAGMKQDMEAYLRTGKAKEAGELLDEALKLLREEAAK